MNVTPSTSDARAVEEVSLGAAVIRCRCGRPDLHAGGPCPSGEVEGLGVVSFWHRSPLRRLAWGVGSKLKRWAEGG